MTSMTLVVDIHSYWQSGGGRGQGAVLDATAHRDADGLPVLPGRHLKGLLREALEAAERWQWQGYEGLAAKLFGDRTEEAKEKLENAKPAPGYLRISDATLLAAANHHRAGSSDSMRCCRWCAPWARTVPGGWGVRGSAWRSCNEKTGPWYYP